MWELCAELLKMVVTGIVAADGGHVERTACKGKLRILAFKLLFDIKLTAL
jgi:hypothetical protein